MAAEKKNLSTNVKSGAQGHEKGFFAISITANYVYKKNKK